MKVDYVLYGEIDRTRQHLSIRLIRVRDGVALLDESYDEKFDDIFNKLTPEGIDKSIDYFRQAIELDPKYAMAYAGLSDSYMRLGRSGRAPADFIPKSRAAVMKALELDETVAYAHSMLGRIAYQYDWDFPRAEREYARARELNPKLVHAWYGSFLLNQNRVAEAEEELLISIEQEGRRPKNLMFS